MTPDRTIVVTGAAGGLGSAIARALVASGANVFAVDHGTDPEGQGSDEAALQPLEQELGRERLATSHADVLASEAAEQAFDAARERFGAVHGLVMAAGARHRRGILKLGQAEVERALALGLTAPLTWTSAFARRWVGERAPGSVVLFTSPSAFFGAQRQAGEAAAAAGIVAATRSAALELRRHRIRVNAVAPTARTRLTEDLPLFKNVKAGSLGPEGVAPLVLHLLSDASEAVHGEVVGAAGGRMYALHARETTGAFAEGESFSAAEVGERWAEITSGR